MTGVTVHQNKPADKVGDIIMDHLSRGGVDSPVVLEYIRFDEDDETFSIKAATGMKAIVYAKTAQHSSLVHYDVHLC